MPIDMSAATAAKAPPRKRQSTVSTPRVSAQNEIAEQRMQAALGLGQLGQGLCVMFGQLADAATIGRYWTPIAEELVPIANLPGNEWLGSGLDFFVKIGPYTALAYVLMPFGLQIAANHKWVDADKLGGQGVVPPEVLTAQMQAQTAQMQVDALKAKNEALQHYARMQAEHAQAVAEYNTLTNPTPEGSGD